MTRELLAQIVAGKPELAGGDRQRRLRPHHPDRDVPDRRHRRGPRRPERAAPDDRQPLMTGQHIGSGPSGPPAEPPRDYPGLFLAERARLASCWPDSARRTGTGRRRARGGPSSGSAVTWSATIFRFPRPPPRRAFREAPGPDDAGETEFIWLDGLQDEWVRAARRLSPRIVADLLAWAGPQVAETMRGEDPRARTADVSWAGTGPVPAWLDQARELSEYWIHHQQASTRRSAAPATCAPTWPGRSWTACAGRTRSASGRPRLGRAARSRSPLPARSR